MSNDRAPELTPLKLDELKDARFELSPSDQKGGLQVTSPQGLCQYAHSLEGSEWAGLVYTTRGFFLVYGVSGDSVKSTKDAPADLLDTAYELRLWRVNLNSDADDVLAHELRWVNGSGAVELRVLKATGAEETRCWYRENQYLQHGQPIEGGQVMTSVEVFTLEEDGNVVFADELMTGKWAQND